MSRRDAIIIGAGVAGLTCASHLYRAGYDVLLIEASDDVGGRARTDVVNGFLLDRGLHTLLTTYPETRSELDYHALRVGHVMDGARVYHDGVLHTLADPVRHPREALRSFRSPIGTTADRLRLTWMRTMLTRSRPEEILVRPEIPTWQALKSRWRFSDEMIQRYFRPLVGSYTFDPELNTSARIFEILMRSLALGRAALPAEGIQAVPRQIAASIPRDRILLNTTVEKIEINRVMLGDGTIHQARAVIIATTAAEASRLAERPIDAKGVAAACIYYAAPRAPFTEPYLLVNGSGRGPIMSLSVQTNIAPTYSPDQRALIAVVPFDPQYGTTSDRDIRRQLIAWFGAAAESWRHLRSYYLPYALPDRTTNVVVPAGSPRIRERLYMCGDHRHMPSLNGAMASGRQVARAVAADLGPPTSTRLLSTAAR